MQALWRDVNFLTNLVGNAINIAANKAAMATMALILCCCCVCCVFSMVNRGQANFAIQTSNNEQHRPAHETKSSSSYKAFDCMTKNGT